MGKCCIQCMRYKNRVKKKEKHKYDKNIFLTQRFNKLRLAHTGGITPPTTFKVKPFFLGNHILQDCMCLQPQYCWFALLQVWCSGQGSGVLTRGNVNVPLTPFSCFMCNPCIVLSETKRDVSSREGTGQQIVDVMMQDHHIYILYVWENHILLTNKCMTRFTAPNVLVSLRGNDFNLRIK